MELKKKWEELDKQKKILIGIGSVVAVGAVGTGVVVGTTGAAEQPSQTKVVDNTTKSNRTEKSEGDDKDKEKLNNDEKETDVELKSTEVEDKNDKETSDEKKKEDSELESKGNNENPKSNEKQTEIQKDNGTKVKVAQTTGTTTPKATVKVEKKQEAPKSSNTSSSTTPSNQSVAKDTNKEKTSNEKETKDVTTTKTTTSTETIAFDTIRQNDSSLEKGKEVVSQNGQNGVRTITYKETYVNGILKNKEQVSAKTTKSPVNKVVKVGTKEAPKPQTNLSSSQAKGILNNSNLNKSSDGTQYYLQLGSYAESIRVFVGSNGVSKINYNGNAYISWSASLEELVMVLGQKEGKEAYDYGQKQRKEIERAVRAAANSVYGSGTSQANSLYSQIINSNSYSKSF